MTLVSMSFEPSFVAALLLESLLGGAAKLLDELDERRPFPLGQAAGGAIHRLAVMTEDFADALGPVGSQRDDPAATVARIGAAHDQPPLFKAVDRGGDGTAGELDALTKCVDRLRSTVQQNIHARNIHTPPAHPLQPT